jgi:hypothetical protein
MGEAKRRKQLDANYGKVVHQIRTTQDFDKHLIRLFRSFSEEWYEYVEGTNFDLDEVIQKLTNSIEKKFSFYKSSDQQLLATALIHLYSETANDYLEILSKQDDAVDKTTVHKLFVDCLIKILKPWLNEHQQQ